VHAAPPLAKSLFISSFSSKKCLPKISVGYLKKWFTIYFTADGWRICPFNLPLSAPACCWVPFRLSKHCLSNSFPKHQSNSQAELSKPTTEDFKLSKRKRTRRLPENIPTYQSGLQCDACIPNHLVTSPVTKGRVSPPWRNFILPWKNDLDIL